MIRLYKYIHTIYMPLVVLAACASPLSGFGQVSAWDRIRIVGRNSFNYDIDALNPPTLRKNRSSLVVYSDRNNNQAYEDPYFQRKAKQQEMGTAYYVIGEENDNYELVCADPGILGKPKIFFSFLLNKKRHFKTPESVKYVGWIPKNNLLAYSHAFVDEKNNLPIKYRIGITHPGRLFNLSKYFRGDTLTVYNEPFLRNKIAGGLQNGQIVYVYKYDPSGRAALVSDCPSLEDTSRKILGWVPADFVAKAGQQQTFLLHTDNWRDSIPGIQNLADTFYIHEYDLQSKALFNYQGNTTCEGDDTEINFPVAVWNRHSNNLINIKGGNIPASDIRRMEAEHSQINIHFLFFDGDSPQANRFSNTLQNLKLKLFPENSYAFTATLISPDGNRYSSLTSGFAEWLNFISDATTHKERLPQADQAGLNPALQHILEAVGESAFSRNIFIILGSNQDLNIRKDIVRHIAKKSGSFLFVQTKRSTDKPYQDFILQAKSIQSYFSEAYVDFITNYIVDDNLVKPEFFQNVAMEDANIYLYDAPANSLSVGGIIFPKGRGMLQNTSLDLALDSLHSQIRQVDQTLLKSLHFYEHKIGTLRSSPTKGIEEILARSSLSDTLPLTNISRNSIQDTYYIRLSVPDSILTRYKNGYLFNASELENLLQRYRGLLPEFTDSIRKKEFRVLRRVYRKQRRSINKDFHRKVLKLNPTVADLFYYRTGIQANEELLQTLKIRRLKVRKCKKNGFHETYSVLVDKMKKLEDLYMQNEFETVDLSGDTYYFIPKQFLL
ncbi:MULTISPECIES: type VI secretion system protein TssR domain-containing protein [Bacteroidaceae]|uniref:VWA domain-containing protein n=1 Tax=Phocaeicola barnesiae TaxID=376804 RepID=A0AAW5N8I7_9BACT|nr:MULTISPECIES: type VI secretion system protein TssR domain-containing protein [Bacteroidaceae]MBM6671799.1 hypothetical protein [Phocaeicola coprophilus]MBM6720247.1 hypothetical protein [Bacteroides gallinaceum]MBM6781679.1 hypothetical protein [Bacteroides mediterraneensis]MCR8875186.1 hypothetical protein [Phocaeicola barnesiae]